MIFRPYEFSFPITVRFGRDSSKKAGDIAKSKHWERGVIITDKNIVKAGLIDGITESLKSNGIAYDVFNDIHANPRDTDVEDALAVIKKNQCDFLIGIGGGSSIDTAKISALLNTNSGKIKDYEILAFDDLFKGRVKNFPSPLIAIPTTAGTGTEADFWACATDTANHYKMNFGQVPLYPGAPYVGPTISLLDPNLTLTLPAIQTASTGIDVLYHALETYVANDSTPLVEPIALHAISLVSKYLPIAFAYGSDIEAREAMIIAADLGGMCLNYANVGAIHALGMQLGGMHENIPHGIANTTFLHPILEYNRIAVPDKFAKIAIAMGEKVDGMTSREASVKAVNAIMSLVQDLNLPTNLKSVGVKEEDLPIVAEKAAKTLEIVGNPRAMNYEQALMIAQQAYDGRVGKS